MPRYGVALFGSTVSERLSPSREELPVNFASIMVSGLARIEMLAGFREGISSQSRFG